MRILFMGGKNIGCACFEYLIEREENVIGVIPNIDSDTLKDRWYRSITEIAIKNEIPVYGFKNINDKQSIEFIKNLKPDIIFVVYYDKILKKELIDIPPKGCINLHLALAEEYRGCYPTTWALINGEKRYGVTLHYIDEGVDTGDIIAQKEFEIEEDDTGETLYDKTTKYGIKLFKEVFPLIKENKVKARKQITNEKTKTYKRIFPSREIKIDKKTKDYIRALIFEPFKEPYFYIGKKKMIVKEEKEKE